MCLKGQLFDGLEEDESRFDSDSFVPKRSVRSLVIKSNRQSGSLHGCSPPSFLSTDDVASRNQQQLSNGRNGRYGTDELFQSITRIAMQTFSFNSL